MPRIGGAPLLIVAVLAAVGACVGHRARVRAPGACLGADWRTAVMEVWLKHQATDTTQGARYYQQELGIRRDTVPHVILVRDDQFCRTALAAFDRINPRPSRTPRTRGYVLRFGSNVVVRDPADERQSLDPWAYAAIFRSDWTYVFYQGFYRCTGGTAVTGEVDCSGGP